MQLKIEIYKKYETILLQDFPPIYGIQYLKHMDKCIDMHAQCPREQCLREVQKYQVMHKYIATCVIILPILNTIMNYHYVISKIANSLCMVTVRTTLFPIVLVVFTLLK